MIEEFTAAERRQRDAVERLALLGAEAKKRGLSLTPEQAQDHASAEQAMSDRDAVEELLEDCEDDKDPWS